MTVAAQQFVEQFKRLPDADKREVVEAIVRESAIVPVQTHQGRKSVVEIRSFSPLPDADIDINRHDRDFVDAIIESKKLSPSS